MSLQLMRVMVMLTTTLTAGPWVAEHAGRRTSCTSSREEPSLRMESSLKSMTLLTRPTLQAGESTGRPSRYARQPPAGDKSACVRSLAEAHQPQEGQRRENGRAPPRPLWAVRRHAQAGRRWPSRRPDGSCSPAGNARAGRCRRQRWRGGGGSRGRLGRGRGRGRWLPSLGRGTVRGWARGHRTGGRSRAGRAAASCRGRVVGVGE
jgi:hypothetical protein